MTDLDDSPRAARGSDRASRIRALLGLLSLTVAFVVVVMVAAVLVQAASERFREEFVDTPISTHRVNSGEFEFDYFTGFVLEDASAPSGNERDYFIVTASVDFDVLDRTHFAESVSPRHLTTQRIDRRPTEFFVSGSVAGETQPSKEEFFAAAQEEIRERMRLFEDSVEYLAEPTVTERIVDGMPALDIRLHQRPVVARPGILEQQEAYLFVYNGAVGYRIAMFFELTVDNAETIDRLLTSIRVLEER